MQNRIDIPKRKNIVVKAKTELNCNHQDQLINAFILGFNRYQEAMRKLSEV